MTSSGPYTQPQNFTHAFDIPDLRGPLPKGVLCEGTLWWLICRIPEFSGFRWIVERAKLNNIFNDKAANYTVFIPSNDGLDPSMLANLGVLEARSIVRSYTVQYKIDSDVLCDDPIYYLYPIDSNNRLCITNLNGETRIDGKVKVTVFDLKCNNGIAHVVDGLIRVIVDGGGV